MQAGHAVHDDRGSPASRRRLRLAAAALTLACALPLAAAAPALPRIGPAPQFTLTDQHSRPFSLRDVKGRVAVVTFLFTSCSDTCPVLTAKLVAIQRQLGPDQSRVQFVGITVDPLHDTPPVLKRYAAAHSADQTRFSFLTGSFDQITDVSKRYAVFFKQQKPGSVDHTFLTSIVDQQGTLRVQYLGWRFDTNEFLADIRSLLPERGKR
jgi:protein SCO1/2